MSEHHNTAASCRREKVWHCVGDHRNVINIPLILIFFPPYQIWLYHKHSWAERLIGGVNGNWHEVNRVALYRRANNSNNNNNQKTHNKTKYEGKHKALKRRARTHQRNHKWQQQREKALVSIGKNVTKYKYEIRYISHAMYTFPRVWFPIQRFHLIFLCFFFSFFFLVPLFKRVLCTVPHACLYVCVCCVCSYIIFIFFSSAPLRSDGNHLHKNAKFIHIFITKERKRSSKRNMYNVYLVYDWS